MSGRRTGRGPGGPLAAGIFSLVVRCRNLAYDRGWLPRARAPLPVISIGNLTAGGAGKTPLVLHLAERLVRAGVPVGVLTRGYRRTDRRPLVLAPGAPLPAWTRTGDEPWLLRRRLPAIALGIDADRARAARALAPHLPGGAFLLDDGFQHRQLHRELDLVVVPVTEPLADGRLLPAGHLREPATGLARAHLVVLMSAPGSSDPLIEGAARAAVSELAPGRPVAVARSEITGVRGIGASDALLTPLAALAGPVAALAGIARPERLARAIEASGVEVGERCFFPDHHRFSATDRERIASAASRVRAIVTTEKDEPRLLDAVLEGGGSIAGVPVLVARLAIELVAGERALLQAVGGAAGVTLDPPGTG
jgi:tetraacyldisaccharide 4'-kinase